MILNNGIYVQRKTTKRIRLLFILSNIRKNTRDHDKKENEKKDTISH